MGSFFDTLTIPPYGRELVLGALDKLSRQPVLCACLHGRGAGAPRAMWHRMG
jgi:hypothetical protein